MSSPQVAELNPQNRRLASKWFTVIAGLAFAIPGLWGVVANVPKFDKFATRTWMQVYNWPATYRSGTSRLRIVPLSDTQHAVIRDGFEPGQEALFCMVLFEFGTGVAMSRFLGITGRRNLALALSVTWHGLGIATTILFWKLAPRPLTTYSPLLTIGIFEWLGLFPLALGVSKEWYHGKWHEAVWNAWIGAIPGAILGAVAGLAMDFIRMEPLKQNAPDGSAVSGWIVGLLVGGALMSIGLGIWGFCRVLPSRSPPTDHL